MGTFEEERERDFAAYEQLKVEIPGEYRGQFIAIADGRLVMVAPTIEQAREAVKGYRHRLVFSAEAEPIKESVSVRWLTN